MSIAIIFTTFFGLILIVWWRKNVNFNYRNHLTIKENTDNKKLLKEYKAKNAELEKENEKLAKIIHRNNKMLPSMMLAVEQVIKDPHGADAQQTLAMLKRIYAEHGENLKNFQSEQDIYVGSGNTEIDSTIKFLYSYARSCGTAFDFDIKPELTARLIRASEGVSLGTIICDIGENAIISAKNSIDPRICAVFGLSEDNSPRLSFYDNGAPFDEKVIKNLGVKRITTHENEGGSGIGLTTLFEFLHEYKASFCIDENPQKEGFTKCVSVTFDGLEKVEILPPRNKK